MTTRTVVGLIGEADTFNAEDLREEEALQVRFNAPGRAECIRDRTAQVLADSHLEPASAAWDLYRLAALVYSADRSIRRPEAFDSWTRHIQMYLPDPGDVWADTEDLLSSMLGFLTGDRWDIEFRDPTNYQIEGEDQGRGLSEPPENGVVCLFSGGLDSLVGAIDGLEGDNALILTSHNAAGMATFSSPAQNSLFEELLSHYGPDRVRRLKHWVQPPPLPSGTASETSQRSRSLLFLALAVLASTAFTEPLPVLIPENGFISLNIPLTPNRLGSHSTRTTHPHFLQQFRELLDHLDLEVEVSNPYRYQTKGEMLQDSRNRPLLERLIPDSVSCAKTGGFRWEPDEDRRQAHCGYCVPCLIRRAAINAAGLENQTGYRYDIPGGEEGRTSDPRAVRIAIQRASGDPSPAQVLQSGPVPPESIEQYLEVYRRGLRELEELLNA